MIFVAGQGENFESLAESRKFGVGGDKGSVFAHGELGGEAISEAELVVMFQYSAFNGNCLIDRDKK